MGALALKHTHTQSYIIHFFLEIRKLKQMKLTKQTQVHLNGLFSIHAHHFLYGPCHAPSSKHELKSTFIS